jgi:hypothetical protein
MGTIRLHDKVLLVLSEHSVNSSWVRSEVENALEREERHRAQVLFPVRLDDAIKNADQAWAADIRRQRQIGDSVAGRSTISTRRRSIGWCAICA